LTRSVTEGEDKPLKYPLAFNTSHVVVVTKIDLAQAVGYVRSLAQQNVYAANPGISILELSARTGAGMDEWIDLIDGRIRAKALAPTH
jgi:hydrogenase nickel incorporation protein HypB